MWRRRAILSAAIVAAVIGTASQGSLVLPVFLLFEGAVELGMNRLAAPFEFLAAAARARHVGIGTHENHPASRTAIHPSHRIKIAAGQGSGEGGNCSRRRRAYFPNANCCRREAGRLEPIRRHISLAAATVREVLI